MKPCKLLASVATASTLFLVASGSVAVQATPTPDSNGPTNFSQLAAPGSVSAQGTIEKYIHFDVAHTNINLSDIGGPTFGTSSVGFSRTFGSSQGTPGQNPADEWVASGTDNSAEVVFDANTHIRVVITNGADMSNSGIPGIRAGDVDTLPTMFRTWVKGRGVTHETQGPLTVNNTTYRDLGLTPSGGATAGQVYTQPSLVFSHGLGSGLKLDVQVTRSGENDHFGIYTTSATLSWIDLN